MLFNSYTFILFFLPCVLGGFALAARYGGRRLAVPWLIVASLFYYGWWNPRFLLVLVLSMLVNAALGKYLCETYGSPAQRRAARNIGIAFNLLLLGFFKYTGFLVFNLNSLFGSDIKVDEIVLPIGISFFTFLQIAFLVDAYRRDVVDFSLTNYFLFVSFFPHLIAGPIVHHKEMMPQLAGIRRGCLDPLNIAIGLSIFTVGLFKKTIIADNTARLADPVFLAVAAGTPINAATAWTGALAYSFQIYFDFSGYSDMAIGLARLFGIVFPLNFYSPYRAVNMIEFWRRWHMTLSRFLRNYLYIPLGGNRLGERRRYANLILVMLLGGLWHGAAWTFVLWGGLHGLFLVINHSWRYLRERFVMQMTAGAVWTRLLAWLLTFVCVTSAWVIFRADSVDHALRMLASMCLQGPKNASNLLDILSPHGTIAVGTLLHEVGVGTWLAGVAAIAFLAPNTSVLFRNHNQVLPMLATLSDRLLVWRPTMAWGVAIGVLFVVSVLHLTHITPFLYFQF